jgi:hypothetical protein
LKRQISCSSAIVIVLVVGLGDSRAFEVGIPPTTARAYDFLHTLGVCTHDIQQQETAAAITAGLLYTGIPNVREDATHNTSGPGSVQDLCNIHAATGALFDELPIVDSDPNNIPDTKAMYDQLASCGAMLEAEGPNEPNNFGFTYQGRPCNNGSFLGCAIYQRDLYAMVKADPLLAGFPVLGMTEIGAEPDNSGAQFLTVPPGQFTELPAGTVFADVANAHNYVQGNGGAGSVLADNQARAAEYIPRTIGPYNGLFDSCNEYWGVTWREGHPVNPAGLQCEGYPSQFALPKVTTETGWNTAGNGVSTAMQGKLLTDVYLDAYQLGWARTFIYLMFNEGGYAGGMFNINGDTANASNATPLGTYIHNMTTILADTSSALTPTDVAITVTGLPATGYYQMMQLSTGTHGLVLWGEAFASQTSTPVMVTFPVAEPSIKVYDVTTGTAPISTTSGSSVTVNLIDHPMIVEF